MKFAFPPRALLFAMGLSIPLFAGAQELDTPEQQAGYGIGVNIGSNLSSQGVAEDIDIAALLMGIEDAVSGELKMEEQEIMAALQAFSAQQEAKAMAELEAQAEAGRAFLAENANRDGVVTTDSGLQYEVLTKGEGGASPTASDSVNVHYHGTLVDGSVFDSSIDRGQPVSFPLGNVIPGWTEGLQLMSVGDKYRFFVPSELAYGANGAPPLIGPNATLIFDVELLSIEEQE